MAAALKAAERALRGLLLLILLLLPPPPKLFLLQIKKTADRRPVTNDRRPPTADRKPPTADLLLKAFLLQP
jgi:hypothetical protein